MSLVVTVETERGEHLRELVDGEGHLGRLVLSRESEGALGSIDPFGQTMFNRLQLQQLIGEIHGLLTQAERVEGENTFLREFASLARYCLDEGPHLYLWTRGD